MAVKSRLKVFFDWRNPSFWMALSFFLWLFLFRGFITGDLILFEDAYPYYDHTKFYLDNLLHGVYPLWDPYWESGVPNDFFLRRIGPYNPFLLLVPFFKIAGLSFLSAYLLYLCLYVLIGCCGLYLLAKRILRHDLSAFAAYLIFLFSALNTRIFDSFLLLVVVPLIWFFYFLVTFSEKPNRHDFLGIVLTMMLLGTTYIPLFFITILWSFAGCYLLVYFKEIPALLRRYGAFICQNKVLTLIGLSAVVYAFLPGILFFLGGRQGGEIVLPRRNDVVGADNVLTVAGLPWSIMEELVFTKYFELRDFYPALFYVSPFIFIILFLGFAARINRLTVFMGLWIIWTLAMTTPYFLGVYEWLHEHVFYFKYFRNPHFYLWFVLLPLGVLFLAEQLRQNLSYQPKTQREHRQQLGLIIVAHILYFIVIVMQNNLLVPALGAGALSLLFFIGWQKGMWEKRRHWALCVLTAAIILQPVVVFYNFTAVNAKRGSNQSPYDKVLDRFQFKEKRELTDKPYYATGYYYGLLQNVNVVVLRKYLQHKFVIYDRVENKEDATLDFKQLEGLLAEDKNVAWISSFPGQKISALNSPAASALAYTPESNSPEFQVVAYDVNGIILRTNFPKEKFLVYNNSFHRGWHAQLNGNPVEVARANIAFQGVFVPAGANTLVLHFENPRRYVFEIGILFATYAVFVAMLVFWYRNQRKI